MIIKVNIEFIMVLKKNIKSKLSNSGIRDIWLMDKFLGNTKVHIFKVPKNR